MSLIKQGKDEHAQVVLHRVANIHALHPCLLVINHLGPVVITI